MSDDSLAGLAERIEKDIKSKEGRAETPIYTPPRPHMAMDEQVSANQSNEISIVESIKRFTVDIASYIEQEAERRLSAEKMCHETMLAFAQRIRITGIGE